ncbi:MAG: ABC transporter permease subunit [Phycisphaerales bacterium]|jgi:ABC-type phosphate transport system permease subunit|nr:ABC transporter permease subunit [Phycisphaerales bacterium]
MLWLTAAAIVVCLVAIVSLTGLVIVQGAKTFWPGRIERVELASGGVLMGIAVDEEATPDSSGRAGDARRRLYRVGNRDVGAQAFEWIDVDAIAGTTRPSDAGLFERRTWGVWIGTPRSVFIERVTPVLEGELLPEVLDESTAYGPARGERVEIEPGEDGGRRARERLFLVQDDPEAAWTTLGRMLPDAQRRWDRIERLKEHDIGRVSARMERLRLRVREAELASQRGARTGLGWGAWSVVAACGIGSILAGVALSRRLRSRPDDRRLRAARGVCVLLALPLVLASVLERPWSSSVMSGDELAAFSREMGEKIDAIRAGEFAELERTIAALEAEDAQYRIEIIEASGGRIAPRRQSEPDEALQVSQIVRSVRANDLTFSGRLGVYFSRWWEFLSEDPRSANTEGGVFPVIFGTVLLTLLLSVIVVPLGVVAALYLREYARQGPLTSVIRIAVNNLAGVPSIVYGVFGLGFFCTSVGQFIDAGSSDPLPPVGSGGVLGVLMGWWPLAIVCTLIAMSGVALRALALPGPGLVRSTRGVWLARFGALAWFVCVVIAIVLIVRLPYFGGFFSARLPTPTFGTTGLLWASLTLALLTLPVVIVATEEAIAAVPRSMREGSYGCGASKWQTIRRIVLPGATPGILTGAILAMARGAGEVAPLMVVGAVKLAPELPIDAEAPFMHLQRSFMHLGFHIYDLGFQSPDSEAARPLVWTTTLLLVSIVVLMNLAAILVRSRVRARLRGSQG